MQEITRKSDISLNGRKVINLNGLLIHLSSKPYVLFH